MDGRSALIFPTSAGNTSIEMLEQRSPVLIEHKGYVEGSAGHGATDSGEGKRFTMRAVPDQDVSLQVSVLPEGMRVHPPGLLGGESASSAQILLNDKALPEGGLIDLSGGEALQVRMPGGGDYGPPPE